MLNIFFYSYKIFWTETGRFEDPYVQEVTRMLRNDMQLKYIVFFGTFNFYFLKILT